MNDDRSETNPSFHQQRRQSDRRSGQDRRSVTVPWDGEERRKTNRRHAADRRGLQFGIFYKTDQSLGVLYDWLGENCTGTWSVGLEEAGSATDRKSVKVLFEQDQDKTLFMNEVVRAKKEE